MYRILKKETLSEGVFSYIVEAPRIAKKAEPGQFVILRVNEKGERIPLTIADYNRQKGTITIIFQIVGATTQLLSEIPEGGYILDFVGPLGKKSEIKKYMGTVVCIGGGIGIAPIHPIAKAMKKSNNKVISIIGARSKNSLIMEENMKKISNELIVTTDDGSYGVHGFVTTALQKIIDRGEKIDIIYAIGPLVMMKSVVELTRALKIKTIVSLNPIMIDGTGMCGGCRVQVGGALQFACVDGPEFDGHMVDFADLIIRQGMYKKEENYAKEHICRIGLGG